MPRDDWYRKVTWSPQAEADFQARLKRSRGSGNKAQYLCIQAGSLAANGNHSAALSLADQMIRDFPERIFLAGAHLQRAESLAALGRHQEAIDAFRACLEAQRQQPNVRTGGELEFAWFLVTRRFVDRYYEALDLIDQYVASMGCSFPIQRFRCAALRALIAQEWGEKEFARKFAAEAQEAAYENHSGFRYHPTLGLVEQVDANLAERLRAILGE